MSARRLHPFAFREPQPLQRHHLKLRAKRYSLSGHASDVIRQLRSSSYRLRLGRWSPSLFRLCEDRTKFLIFCASILTRAGSFCPLPRSMVGREFSLIASCMSSSLSSDLRGNGSPQPEKRTSATGRSWPCIETPPARLMTTLTRPPFLRHSPGPKVIPRLYIFHTSPRRQSDVCSGSIFPTCCFSCACSALQLSLRWPPTRSG